MSRESGTLGRRGLPRALATAENVALAAVVAGMAIIVLLQIGSRLLLGEPLSWSTEVATYLLIWSAFLGFAVGVRERAHVALSIVEDRLSGRTLYAVKVLQLVVFAFLLGALTYGGALMAAGELGTVSAAGIPRWIPIAAIPVGAGLGLIHVAAQALALGHSKAETEAPTFRPLQTTAAATAGPATGPASGSAAGPSAEPAAGPASGAAAGPTAGTAGEPGGVTGGGEG